MNPYLHARFVVTFLAAASCLVPQFAGTAYAQAQAASRDRLWQQVDQLPAAPANARIGIRPTKFQAFTTDAALLRSTLAQAPIEFTAQAPAARVSEITLPKPDGTFARFQIEEVALMEPALAARYPGIKTYRGRGIDDPMASLHLDINPQTFHAQVLSPSGTYYIDPYWKHDGSVYMSYAKSDLTANGREFKCLVDESTTQQDAQARPAMANAPAAPDAITGPNNVMSGKHLRTYRLACATSMLYSQYHGGTNPDVALVLAALVTMNNRVSGVYETELGIRMVLVANQEAIIASSTNPTPYSDTPGDIGTNPAYIDTKIGEGNYDIGHVVTTGSGGVAGLGVVCRGFNPASGGSSKARGTTGIDPPEGDGFWIDFVAHEMGHQFGGNHTFDGTGTNCGTNQNPETAYEPGSGTTIQAYAGICGNQNIQPHSDPFFHFASLEEMFEFVTSGIASRAPGILLQKAASTAPPPAPEATPSSGTLNPNPGESITWRGTAVGGAALDDETCEEGVTCDTFNLTLTGQASDWQEKSVKITFNWPNATDDYDFYVRKDRPDGPLVDEGSATGDRPEIANIEPSATGVGTGVFIVRGVYFLVAPLVLPELYQYTAVATVVDQASPGPAPTCAVVTDTGNNPPTVEAGPDFKIPARTPFALTAAGTDPDGNPITYCWEEADLGPNPKDANLPDDGTNPIIRSFPPTPNPTRIIPRLPDLFANQNQKRDEKLPTTSRELKFRVTVRDNIFGGHGFDAMKIDAIDSGAGFAVTSPNTAVSFPGGSTQTVTWDVANSLIPEINTTHVNIALTTDGGNTYVPLATNVPNDGSESVVIPNVNSTTARIKVEAVGNIFFDVSNEDFSIVSTIPAQAQLLNISSRAHVQTGEKVLIGGFIVTGTDPKQVIVRAIGPSLKVGGTPVVGRMENPVLELLNSSNTIVASNDNWVDSPERSQIEATGIAPTDDRESAIVRTLVPGNYTAILKGKDNTTGIAVVEAYDIGLAANSILANISSRSFVEAGDNVLIGGFIAGMISNNNPIGTGILVRAIGPSRKSQIPNALDDPVLELHDFNGNTIATNDNWIDSPQRAQIEATGIPPTNNLESAIYRILTPAPYTAIVRGKDGGTGVGVVEIYNIR
jgi:Metallo-peptidase family M12B Reprolysin-like